MSADITVIGLVEGSHVVEDIQYNVPKGITVTIPAELAYRSRDLWRAISQRLIFQVSGSAPSRPVVPYQQENEDLKKRNADLQKQLDELRSESQALREEAAALRSELAQYQEQRSKLDEILALVRGGPTVTTVAASGPAQKAASAVVADEVPLFIPDSIRPKDVVADNLTIEKDQSEASSVLGASSKLKSFKRKAQ